VEDEPEALPGGAVCRFDRRVGLPELDEPRLFDEEPSGVGGAGGQGQAQEHGGGGKHHLHARR
jgi:hypothetical protein